MSDASRHAVAPPVPAGERYQTDLARSDIVDPTLPTIKLDAHTLRLVGPIAAARANHRACVSNRDLTMSDASRHAVVLLIPAGKRATFERIRDIGTLFRRHREHRDTIARLCAPAALET
jgi:hypothetical protein